MITLLRKVRKKLLTRGSMSSYLFYAIGEILLVVIGILIALQINNWNENRKARQTELLALIDLKDEFVENRTNFKALMAVKNDFSLQWKNYLHTISNKKLPKDQRAINRPRLGSRTFKISNSTLNSLLNSGKIDNIENDTLKHLLSTWFDELKAYQEVERMHYSFSTNEMMPYESTLDFNETIERLTMKNPFHSEQKIKELHLASHENLTYQNLLMRNYFYLNLQLNESKKLQHQFVQIIDLLEKEIQNKKN